MKCVILDIDLSSDSTDYDDDNYDFFYNEVFGNTHSINDEHAPIEESSMPLTQHLLPALVA